MANAELDRVMSSNSEASSAIERARLAYTQMKRRQHRAELKRRTRERVRNTVLAVMIATAVTLFIGIVVYNGWVPETLRSSSQDMHADKGKDGGPRTAHVRSFIKGNTCQDLEFSNASGSLVGGSLVPCDAEARPDPLSPGTPEGARLNAIRDRFTTR
jgi:hypothetical protein